MIGLKFKRYIIMAFLFRYIISSSALVRYSILFSYTLTVVHFFIYQKLPFQEGYQFPWFSYAIISFMAAFICTINHWAYKTIPLPNRINSFFQKVVYQVLLNIIVGFLSYSFIYLLINQVIFKADFNLLSFLKFLAISEAIVVTYILSITSYKLYSRLSAESYNHQNSKISLIVPSGQKDLQLKISNIVFIYSKAGIVSIHLKNHERLITQYSSIDEIQDQLPADKFYRVSRQYLICKEAVKEIQKDKNRKLILYPDPALFNGHTEAIVISRYRSKEFKKWLKGDSEAIKHVPAI